MKNLSIYKSITVVISTIIFMPSLSLAAQSNEAIPEATGFSSVVTLDYVYDDNILSDQTRIIDANIFIVSPLLKYKAQSGANKYAISLSGKMADYEGSSEDNYFDTDFTATADLELTSFHRVSLLGSVAKNHNDRGTSFSQGFGGLIPDPDEFLSTNILASYSYGRLATAGQWDFTISNLDIDYDERLKGTVDVNFDRDRADLTAALGFSYGITSNMNFVATYNTKDIEYDVDTGLDNTEDNLYLGLSWQSSAKTSGSASVGYSSKELDIDSSKVNGSVWQVNLDWAPLSYSTVSFSTNKSHQEFIGVGNFGLVKSYALSWAHDWKSRLSTNFSITQRDVEFDGTSVTDESTTYQASIFYQIRNWFGVNLSYSNVERTTNDVLLPYNYDREIIALTLSFTL